MSPGPTVLPAVDDAQNQLAEKSDAPEGGEKKGEAE